MQIAAADVKLLPHRWAMHAVQALAQRDAALVLRVFTELKETVIDTRVETFGCGAPLQFHDYGFFDGTAQNGGAKPLLSDRVVHGDTLVLLALRRHDPECAKTLLACGASVDVANAMGERPLDLLFESFAAFELWKRDSTVTPSLVLAPILKRQAPYKALFAAVRDRLDAHHHEIRARVETELERFYTQHAPERLAKIETQLTEFEYRERELLTGVQRKYALA